MNHIVANIIDPALITYSVTLWGSNPNLDNDDCYTGADFITLSEARACLANLDLHFNSTYYADVPFILLEGPGVYEIIELADVKKSCTDDDGEWRREQAMQAGMAGGCDAYNDYMGY